MGRPQLSRNAYYANKYTTKRRKITSEQFDQEKVQCERCGGNRMLSERPFEIKYSYYRTYGYLTRRIQWKIRCGNTLCQQPYAVILKPEFYDSAGE
jgi:hypothetical protein